MVLRRLAAAVLVIGFAGSAQAVELPEWDVSGLCKGEGFPGQCQLNEGVAKRALLGGWGLVPDAYRSDCLAQVRQPYDKSYRLLSQCLEGQVEAGLDKDLIETATTGTEDATGEITVAATSADTGAGSVSGGSGSGNVSGYPILPTDNPSNLISLRETWGPGPKPQPVDAPLAAGAVFPLPKDGAKADGATAPVKSADAGGYAVLDTSSLSALMEQREAWGTGAAPSTIEAPLAAGAQFPLPKSASRKADGPSADPIVHAAEIIPAPKLTPVPQSTIEASLKSLLAERASWGDEPFTGYAVLTTDTLGALLEQREVWGPGPKTEPIKAPLARGAVFPLPKDKPKKAGGVVRPPIVHAAENVPVAQLTAVAQGQISAALEALLAEREGWVGAPASGSAGASDGTVAGYPALSTSDLTELIAQREAWGTGESGNGAVPEPASSEGYANLATSDLAALIAQREAWGKGAPAKQVDAPLAVGAIRPLPKSEPRNVSGPVGDPIVNPADNAPVAQLTPVPQDLLSSELKSLLAEREGWGKAPGAGGGGGSSPASGKTEAAQACEDDVKRTVESGGIQFRTNSAEIESGSFATLDKVAEAIKACGDLAIEIAGHTDSSGSDAVNQRISDARAASVKAYLVDKGVPGSRLTSVGYGESRPLVPNTSRANRAQNRRIEFIAR